MYYLRLQKIREARERLGNAVAALNIHEPGQSAAFTAALADACGILGVTAPSPEAVTALEAAYDSLNA